MSDYIIVYDENGQAYIEHAFWNRKGQTKKNHKYLLKIGEGVKARYFYTKAEVDAYYKNKTGLAKKSQLEEEKKDLRNSEKKAERDEMKAIKAKRGVEYDRNGNEWYTNMNAANRAYDADLEATRSANAVKEAKRRVNVAQGIYDDSLSGKAEKAISNVKSKAERMKEEFHKKKEDAKNKIIETFSNEPPTPKLSSPNNKLIVENIETETIIPEKRFEETIIPEKVTTWDNANITTWDDAGSEKAIVNADKYKVYNKKANPINASGSIPFDTLKRDAAEAGVDFSKYNKAANKVEKLTKQLMREANESKTGYQSLVSPMWYDDPEYGKALKEREEALKELTDILYK